jgi:leucine dehydrogenase
MHLARELHQAGAKLTVSDVDANRAAAVAKEVGAELVSTEAILEVECDVLAPCALGGAITELLAPKLRCKAIGGAANNQLRTAAVGRVLKDRGIWYAPDYAINAGGLINVAEEFAGYDRERSRKKVLAIYDTIKTLIERSRGENAQPEVVADRWADEIIAAGPKK